MLVVAVVVDMMVLVVEQVDQVVVEGVVENPLEGGVFQEE
tara:strand:- start:484 stop:603 length:120 start_codon:yes stop_codon:yes gene_type:complete